MNIDSFDVIGVFWSYFVLKILRSTWFKSVRSMLNSNLPSGFLIYYSFQCHMFNAPVAAVYG